MKVTYFLALLFLTSATVIASESARLVLKKQVLGDPDQLSLADVIDAEQSSPLLLSNYGGISIPKVASGSSLSPSHILLALSRAGADLSQIQLVSSQSIAINSKPKSNIVSKIEEKIIKNLKTELGDPNAQYRVNFTYIPTNLPTAEAFVDLEVQIQDSTRNGVRQFLVSFLDLSHRTFQTATFEGTIFKEATVLVAKRELKANEYVTLEDFEIKTLESDLKSSEPNFTQADFGNARVQLQKDLHLGESLTRKDVNFATVMKKGAIVSLLTGDDRFQIRTTGRVLDVMDQGLSVLVQNLDSKKELIGQPISANEVKILY